MLLAINVGGDDGNDAGVGDVVCRNAWDHLSNSRDNRIIPSPLTNSRDSRILQSSLLQGLTSRRKILSLQIMLGGGVSYPIYSPFLQV